MVGMEVCEENIGNIFKRNPRYAEAIYGVNSAIYKVSALNKRAGRASRILIEAINEFGFKLGRKIRRAGS